MMTSPVLCTRSIVVTVMPAMQVKWGGHSRPMCRSTAGQWRRWTSPLSALAQHTWEHDHHIDWTSMYVLGVESHYWSERLQAALFPQQGPCLIYMISSYCDFPPPSRAEAVQLKEVKPYDYEPISLISIYVCFCNL